MDRQAVQRLRSKEGRGEIPGKTGRWEGTSSTILNILNNDNNNDNDTNANTTTNNKNDTNTCNIYNTNTK